MGSLTDDISVFGSQFAMGHMIAYKIFPMPQ